MEKEITKTTIGTVLTVAVALILVLAMIPAMMPASDDGDSGAKVTSITVTGANTATINYDGGSLNVLSGLPISLGLYWDTELRTSSNPNLSSYRSSSNEEYWFCPSGDGILMSGNKSVNFGDEYYYADFDSASAGSMYIGFRTSTSVMNFAQCAPEDQKIIWEAFFVGSPYKAWDTPEPSNNDVNTVLITTVISMLFISIAVVAVRSFGGRE